jgi:hypothetical protein
VGQLVRHDVHERSIPREQRRRQEGHARVLHAAEREGGRQDDHVVAIPLVRAEEPLGDGDHRLDLRELPGRPLHQARLGPDARARRQVARRQVADRQRQQVRRDRLRHLEAPDARAGPRPRGDGGRAGRHHRRERLRHGERRLIGETHRGGILERGDLARVRRLALAEQERVEPAVGLARLEPLQRGRIGGGLVGDDDRLGAGGEIEAQTTAEDRLLRLERVGNLGAAGGRDAPDRQPLGVEIDPPRRGRRERQARRAGKDATAEIDGEVEGEPPQPRLRWLEVRMRVGPGHVRARPLSESARRCW